MHAVYKHTWDRARCARTSAPRSWRAARAASLWVQPYICLNVIEYIYIYTDMYTNIPGIERDAFVFLRCNLGLALLYIIVHI